MSLRFTCMETGETNWAFLVATSICFQNDDLSVSIFQRKRPINVVYARSIQSNAIIFYKSFLEYFCSQWMSALYMQLCLHGNLALEVMSLVCFSLTQVWADGYSYCYECICVCVVTTWSQRLQKFHYQDKLFNDWKRMRMQGYKDMTVLMTLLCCTIWIAGEYKKGALTDVSFLTFKGLYSWDYNTVWHWNSIG